MTHCQEAMGEEFLEEIKQNGKAPWKDALLKLEDDSRNRRHFAHFYEGHSPIQKN